AHAGGAGGGLSRRSHPARAGWQLADRFHETNQSESIELRTTDLILRRPPSWAAVSKDGHGHGRASGHPSRRAQERALQDEVGARHRYDSNFRNTLPVALTLDLLLLLLSERLNGEGLEANRVA